MISALLRQKMLRTRLARGLFVGIGVVLPTVVIGGLVWWQVLNRPTAIAIPVRTLPKPNAYDYYVKAVALEVGSLNGVSTSPLPNDPPAPLSARIQLLDANQPAIRKLHEGFAYSYMAPPHRGADGLAPDFGYDAKYREMTRCLSFAGQVEEERGNYGRAANYYLDAMRLGSDIPRGGNIVSLLVGQACEVVGRARFWKLADRLSASDARSAVHRLEDMSSRRYTLANALEEEKWQYLSYFQALFEKQSLFRVGNDVLDDKIQLVPRLKANAILLTHSKQRVLNEMSAYSDACIREANRPAYDSQRVAPISPDDPINVSIRPSDLLNRLDVKDRDMRMQNALLTAKLALHTYLLEHQGQFPSALTELVMGRYLSRMPDDPFSTTSGTSLRYRALSSGKYLLYSVGPDGNDDNGKPIDNRYTDGKKRGKQKNWAKKGTVGDFVVGVNVP